LKQAVPRGISMKKLFRTGLLLAVLEIVIVANSGLIMSVSASPDMGCGSTHRDDLFALCWTFDLDFTVGAILSVINMVLAFVLLTVYVGIYRKTGTQFNLVLIIIALTLLCYSVVANPLVSAVLGYEGSGLGPFFILPDLFSLAALSALLYLSLKY
jgi:hypothetical protein